MAKKKGGSPSYYLEDRSWEMGDKEKGCGNEESLPYMILSAPHRDAATAG